MNINHTHHYVGIGASAGGLEAIFQLLHYLPTDWDLVLIIILHLPRNYHSQQETIVGRHTSLRVKTIENGDVTEKNTIYLLPGGKKLTIQNGILYLNERLPGEIINKTIDHFFFSLAEDAKENAIGIILSGTGSDGTKGSHAIEENGGIMIVQNPTEAQFDGMPKSAIYFDHPDYILNLKDIPGVIKKHISKG